MNRPFSICVQPAVRATRLRNFRSGRHRRRARARLFPPLIECKYQGLSPPPPPPSSLSPSPRGESLNINIALVPRFSGRPRGSSVRGGDGSDQRSSPKTILRLFRMPARPILTRPQGPPLPRDSALHATKDFYKYLPSCFETAGRRKQNTHKRAQATDMVQEIPRQREAETTQKWPRSEERKMMSVRPGHCLRSSRRGHPGFDPPSYQYHLLQTTEMVSTPLLVRSDVATKTHAPDRQIRSDWKTAT